MSLIVSAFGTFATLALIASGFLFMFTPARGRRVFKDTLVALAIFSLGLALAGAICTSVR